MPASIIVFFLGHYYASIFFQSLFVHRYVTHEMFTMSEKWARCFNLLTYLSMGSSYLDPQAYRYLHLGHHAYSDTAKDPHSPHNFTNVISLMWDTKHRYDAFAYRRVQPEERFLGGYPGWGVIDRLGQSWTLRIVWCLAYTAFYVHFATAWWQFMLLPAHFVMGPMHGAIVNWCGHKYGRTNFNLGDQSRNTLRIDLVTLGELNQNTHHRHPLSPNFAIQGKWFEVDLCYQVMRVLDLVGIIQLKSQSQVETATAE